MKLWICTFLLLLGLTTPSYAASDNLQWDLQDGILTISGAGEMPIFGSPDDQPWAASRADIIEVRYSNHADIDIPNMQYWFTDCINLQKAEIPYTAQIIGTDAFSNCPNLNEIFFYYYDEDDFEIVDGAFYADSHVDTRICLVSDQVIAMSKIRQYDWESDGRHTTYLDVYSLDLYIWCSTCSSSAGPWSYVQRSSTSGSLCHQIYCATCGDYTSTIGSPDEEVDVCPYCGKDVSSWSLVTCTVYYTSSTGSTRSSIQTRLVCPGEYASFDSVTGNSFSHVGTDPAVGSVYSSLNRPMYKGAPSTRQHISFTVYYSPDSINLTWNLNGGSGVESTSQLYGNRLQFPDNPTREGYTFGGWYTSSSLSTAVSSTAYVPSSDRTYYAKWEEAASVDISWSVDGVVSAETYTPGDTLTMPSIPDKTNYQVLGWYTAKTGGIRIEDGATAPSTATTYYAQWIQYFSVTVPATVPMSMSADGSVVVSDIVIANNSTGDIKLVDISVTALNDWTLVPIDSPMHSEKVDSKQVAYSIDSTERIVPESGTLTLPCSAKVSALSQSLTEQQILQIVFVVDWATTT